MRILLLNQYYPPDTAATAKMAALVAETLAERHQVTVLAGRPSYDPSERHSFYVWRRENLGSVAVERVGSTTYPRFRMRHRLSNYLSYLALAVPRALVVPADVILAMTDPPVAGIAGALVAGVRRIPFIYNIRDLYPDVALCGDLVRQSGWVRVWEWLHHRALRRAARVIVLGDDMRERVAAKGVNPHRIDVVRDGAPLTPVVPTIDHLVTRETRCGFRFVLLHAGNLGLAGAWDTLVMAARRLEADGVGLVFVGAGAASPSLQTRVNGSAGIRFLPFRPAEQVPQVLAAGDLHVVTVRRGLEGAVVPSKLYPILAAGRPVLAVASESSDVARIIRRSACGLVADPDDPASIVAAVRELQADPARLEEMGRRARQAAVEFERTVHLRRFVAVVEEACS